MKLVFESGFNRLLGSIGQRMWDAFSASRLYELIGEREVLWRRSSFIRACRATPGGYLPLQLIYDRQSRATSWFGRAIDYYYLHCPMSAAACARLSAVVQWLKGETEKVVQTHGKANVLSLACGGAHDLVSAYRDASCRKAVAVFGVDADRSAVAHAQSVSLQAGLAHFRFHAGNLRVHQGMPYAPFDLALSVGFFDYLHDDTAATLTRRVKRILRPQGKFLVSMTTENQHRAFFERVLGWPLIYRSNERCLNVLRAGGFSGVRLVAACKGSFSVFECSAHESAAAHEGAVISAQASA